MKIEDVLPSSSDGGVLVVTNVGLVAPVQLFIALAHRDLLLQLLLQPLYTYLPMGFWTEQHCRFELSKSATTKIGSMLRQEDNLNNRERQNGFVLFTCCSYHTQYFIAKIWNGRH